MIDKELKLVESEKKECIRMDFSGFTAIKILRLLPVTFHLFILAHIYKCLKLNLVIQYTFYIINVHTFFLKELR